MAKWYEWLPFQTHPKVWDVLEEVEDILSNKGNLRVLLALWCASGRFMRLLRKKPLRFMELQQTCKIPFSTLKTSLEKLQEKELIKTEHKEVQEPRAEKDIPHYVLTDKGFKFCEAYLWSCYHVLQIPTDAIHEEKWLLKNEKERK